MARQDAHRPARRPADGKQVSAARILAAAFGAGAGLLGLEHGFFETRQGSASPGGLVIHAIGSPCQPHSALTPAVTAATPFVLG